MKIFLAKLQRAARQHYSTPIGGRLFTADECQAAADTIRDMTETLLIAAHVIETVAHLRGMELELLPVADKARAILARVQS